MNDEPVYFESQYGETLELWSNDRTLVMSRDYGTFGLTREQAVFLVSYVLERFPEADTSLAEAVDPIDLLW